MIRRVNQKKETSTRQKPDQAELLTDYRKQKIGMRFWQPMQFLDTSSQPDPENFTAADSDQRMG
jgi:hypothetical protein